MSAHTPGRLTVRANGDANSYALLDQNGQWWMSLLLNGQQLTASQEANMRRLAACWNACEGLSTENLEDNISIKDGLRGLNANISAARALLYAVLKESDNNIAAIRRAGGFVDAPPLAERIRQFLEPKP